MSSTDQLKLYKNLIIIKSMSKDFGIAGIRAGYALMSTERVNELLNNGYLWNSSGLAEYFYKTYANEEFFEKYNSLRLKYIEITHEFISEIANIKRLKVYSSQANFVLVECIDGTKAIDLVFKLLINYGIYTRIAYDKIGLEGEFVRIASRTFEENQIILNALLELYV
jgi:histidinol-phosphate/aromatic aminotransferase/cobyric acid decarboxylase-like protein